MAGIQVTPEQLSDASRQLTSGAASIESTLGQLRTQVGPLHSGWSGAAQKQFEQLWTEWQTSGRNLHEALTGIATLTAQAAQSYESTEQGIASSFGR